MRKRCMSRADPRIFFRGGGGEGPGPTARKQSGQLFLVLNLFYSLQRASNCFITENLYFLRRIQRGSNIFWGGGATFSRGGGGGGGRGVQMLISIETHITCDFPGGGRTPYPPAGSALA